MKEIRLSTAGVANCAISLLQDFGYYRLNDVDESAGVLHADIAGDRIDDVHPVAAFDVDVRKVGHALEEAVFAPPNCTAVFQQKLPAWGVEVRMGPRLDGVAAHMADAPEARAFRVAERETEDVAEVLHETRADVLVCYLPVSSRLRWRRGWLS